MILIISEEADYSTSVVVDWLLHFNAKWVRINGSDKISASFEGSDIKISGENINFKLSEIKSVWYRRGRFNLNFKNLKDKEIEFLRQIEFNKITEYIYYKLSEINNINIFFNADVNKLIVCEIAQNVGLKIPKSLLISEKKYLNGENLKLCTKSISGSTILNYDDFHSAGYTTRVSDLKAIPDFFFPSYIQDYIEKKYEIRIFFLKNKFWSMAIFSQNDPTTDVDFRNYNRQKPNRTVPFSLPIDIQEKIKKLMRKLNLNSGSIDMIVSPNLEFYFLEVNPVGQFGMVSNPCNYNLHKIIALNLINDEKH
jgi:ATP-GRASP peptide maturase of grasp-with-spasm system